jgi:hypothetical protein
MPQQGAFTNIWRHHPAQNVSSAEDEKSWPGPSNTCFLTRAEPHLQTQELGLATGTGLVMGQMAQKTSGKPLTVFLISQTTGIY